MYVVGSALLIDDRVAPSMTRGRSIEQAHFDHGTEFVLGRHWRKGQDAAREDHGERRKLHVELMSAEYPMLDTTGGNQ